jgi:hypothetical protein
MADARKPLFIADPACVYFPVSTVGAGAVVRQFIRVINVSSHSARLGIPQTSPQHPSVTATVDVKQGYIASGLHQVVEVQCYPEDFDVVHSFVRIEAQVWRGSRNASPTLDALEQPSSQEQCRQ